MQDPTPHVQKHSLSFQCAVNPGNSARIDVSHVRQVNWETFYFSDSAAMKKFDSNVLKYCGILTDPVTRQRFIPGENSPLSEYGGREFYFWSDSSRQAFEMMPAFYSAPNISTGDLNHNSDSL